MTLSDLAVEPFAMPSHTCQGGDDESRNDRHVTGILRAVLLWAGHAVGGHSGLVMALVIGGFMNVGAYWWSDQLILRRMLAIGHTIVQQPPDPFDHEMLRWSSR
jgi:hypothetical protein